MYIPISTRGLWTLKECTTFIRQTIDPSDTDDDSYLIIRLGELSAPQVREWLQRRLDDDILVMYIPWLLLRFQIARDLRARATEVAFLEFTPSGFTEVTEEIYSLWAKNGWWMTPWLR